jgi:hypothetical protein
MTIVTTPIADFIEMHNSNMGFLCSESDLIYPVAQQGIAPPTLPKITRGP